MAHLFFMNRNFIASDMPIIDLHELAIQNNNPKISHYRQGYESFFNKIPAITSDSPEWAYDDAESEMHFLATELAKESWVHNNTPVKNSIVRTILAMEQPICNGVSLESGAELLVANWKAGFSTPIHGHAPGYMHERLIFGQLRHATYRVVDALNRIVRPYWTGSIM